MSHKRISAEAVQTCACISLVVEVRQSNYVITWKHLIRWSSVLARVSLESNSSLFCQGSSILVSMAMNQQSGVTAILGNRKSCTTKARFDDGEVLK